MDQRNLRSEWREANLHVLRRYIPPTTVPKIRWPDTIHLIKVLSDLREMELQRVIGAQADIQPLLEKLFQRIPLVRQEEHVVAQRTHRDPDLLQIKQIL